MIEIYNALKGQLVESTFRPTWNMFKLGYSQNWGELADIYRRYNYPETYEEFFKMYTEEYGTETFYKIANKLQLILSQPIELCLAYTIKKVIVGTVDGLKYEKEAKKIMEESWGYDVIPATGKNDIEDGVDLFAYKNGVLVGGIQVKPHSFFIGNSLDIVHDRNRAKTKIANSVVKYNIPIFFMIYNKNTNTWKRDGNNLFFNPFTDIKFERDYAYTC